MISLWINYSFPKQAHLYIPAPRCVDVHPSQLVWLENLAQPILGSSMPTDSNEVWDRGACVCGTFLVISKTCSAVPFHFLSALGTSTDSYVSKCLKPSASRDQWKDRLALFPKTIGFCVAVGFWGAAAWWVKEDVTFYCKLPGDPGTKICASEKSAPWWHFKVLRQGALIVDRASPRYFLFRGGRLKELGSFQRGFPLKPVGSKQPFHLNIWI